jgi:hypothetical protein
MSSVIKFVSESLRDQLDWNRGMIFGMLVWGILVGVRELIPVDSLTSVTPSPGPTIFLV